MAQSLLPPRTDDNPESLVFHLVKKSDNVSKYVRRLKEKAGIEKDLTYHCSRHTTASLAISAGADISAVKDVLGHGSITSTEVYAKVALEKKIEAVNLFNGVFDWDIQQGANNGEVLLLPFCWEFAVRLYSKNACVQINLQDLSGHRLFHVQFNLWYRWQQE